MNNFCSRCCEDTDDNCSTDGEDEEAGEPDEECSGTALHVSRLLLDNFGVIVSLVD